MARLVFPRSRRKLQLCLLVVGCCLYIYPMYTALVQKSLVYLHFRVDNEAPLKDLSDTMENGKQKLITTTTPLPIFSMKNLTPPLDSWGEHKTSFCNNNFIGYANLFAELSNVTLDPSKNTNQRGGEELESVKNQNEALEYLKLQRGYFSIDCKSKSPILYKFPKKDPSFLWLQTLSHRKPPDNATFVNSTVIAVKRVEYVNVYHTMTDLFNTFIIMVLFKLQPHNIKILWMDAHPKGTLDSVYETLFGPTIRAGHIHSPMVFQKLIWTINSYQSFINNHRRPSVPYIEDFRKFVLHQFGVDSPRQLNCDHLNVLFIFRHDYVAHPRNMGGTVKRKIQNEEELIQKSKEQFPNFNITGVQLDNLTFKHQLQTIDQTDILIGMHGAGMTMSMFLPKHSALIELYPSYFSAANIHFKAVAKWRNLINFRWQNRKRANERPNFKTYIDPKVINDFILKSKSQMCGK